MTQEEIVKKLESIIFGGQAIERNLWRYFEKNLEKLIAEIKDKTETI